LLAYYFYLVFFFQAEDGIRDRNVTGVQTCALPICTIFDFNIPERWSIAHLYQALLDKEPHIEEITYITTLAGYVHWYLTGEKVLGIGDASGMFPIDPTEKNYRGDLMEKFDGLLQ